MTFRVRLASFLVASLAILQILTAVLVYEVTRRQLIAQGEQQLVVAARTFERQLDDVSQRERRRLVGGGPRLQAAWSIQVKTNRNPASFWLLSKDYREASSATHISS